MSNYQRVSCFIAEFPTYEAPLDEMLMDFRISSIPMIAGGYVEEAARPRNTSNLHSFASGSLDTFLSLGESSQQCYNENQPTMRGRGTEGYWKKGSMLIDVGGLGSYQ